MQLKIGPDAISSYKRLSYTPWHAIAEFVDNSTQSYFDNQNLLDLEYTKTGEGLEIGIIYERESQNGLLRISDNAMGMNRDELERALHVARPPANPVGRSRYGMGMKTASCWIGNRWSIRTKKFGESTEYEVHIDVNKIASGDAEIDYREIPNKRKEDHYTVVEITDHNRKFQGRTIGKIKDFLRSMYREDFRKKSLKLLWQMEELTWLEYDDRILVANDGTPYKRAFEFTVDDRKVNGWVGILLKGSRAVAGFSVVHSGRVIQGWPDAWRPQSLFGQMQGSNDLVNQRLVGEIHLDAFDVSHTKDRILWLGDQEEQVEEQLVKHCGDYKDVAKKLRKGRIDERGPSEIETKAAIDEIQRELQSPEMVDQITIETIPPEQVIIESNARVIELVKDAVTESMSAEIPGVVLIKLFVTHDISPYEPYVTSESTDPKEITIVVNSAHPHWSQLKGAEGVLNYLRHCIYDAVAEWQAVRKSAPVKPATIKTLKDALLRLSLKIEENESENGSSETKVH